MVKTIGAARATEKWVARAGVAGTDYEAGVKAPKTSWSQATQAARTTYQQAVTAGDIGNRYASGVAKAGDAKWSEMAIAKGVGRYSDGVSKSQAYYSSGIGSVIGTIERTTLPARGPRGSSQNYERVKKIGDALHAARISKSVGGGK